MTHHITIRPDGTIKTIYTDDLLLLFKTGKCAISRVSSVEPTTDGRWEADLSPVGGPTLGPFDTRTEALDAEVAYLHEHIL